MSEQFESNLLEIKLNNESNGVDEWILIESEYTFRGERKGCCAKEVLSEKRFDKFRDRVKIISIEENLFEKLCQGHCEKEYFKVEFASRAACWDYIRDKYEAEDKIIIGDVDESLDLSNKDRMDLFLFSTDTQQGLTMLAYRELLFIKYASLVCSTLTMWLTTLN